MNALVEQQAIEALYRASRAGVRIELIVRGVCALRPGVPGVSENIEVRSIVGRFLEHSRTFYFENDGQAEIFCSSADWMERNFFHRIEVAFPIQRPSHRQRILENLELALRDNCQAWRLRADGRYERLSPGAAPKISLQGELLARNAAESAFGSIGAWSEEPAGPAQGDPAPAGP